MGLEEEYSRQVVTWGIIKKADENCESIINNMEYFSSSSSINDDESSSSSADHLTADDDDDDDDDDASSSSTSSTNNSCGGPLFQFADLMSQLPIKRGLSKYYHGKSQTFGSLASVESVEDLGKKETTSYGRRMKSSCRSRYKYLSHRQSKAFGPKATIAKRSSPPKRPFSPSLTSAKAAGTVLAT